MFQYAFGLRQARAAGTELAIDLSLLLDRARGKDHVYRDYDLTIFAMQPKFTVAPGLLRFLYKSNSSKVGKAMRGWTARGKKYVREPHFHVDEKILKMREDGIIYEGWWQSERYFSDIAPEIRKAFAFRTPVLPESQELLRSIRENNSICLNVRRTDFLKTPELNSTNKDYFLRAAAEIAKTVELPHFFIFSDDVEWCAENLDLPYPTILVTHAHKGQKFGNYLQLMTQCKHFIIPNSSFAWWAVWLSESVDKQVIAPKNWFATGEFDTRDLVPEKWVRM